MINITNNLNEMFEFANVDNNDLDGGEDLEDGEIFDDEAEAEETSETEVPKNSKVEIQKRLSVSPSSNNAVSVSKSVLKNDAHNGADRTEKKSENKFANQQRWMDETTKKEEKNRREHFDAEKRFKEKKLKRKKPKDEDSENDGPANFKGKKRKTSFERELEKLEDSDYIDEEDEEMLNIRGASPSRWLDIFSDEEDDSFDGSEGGGRGGGREHLRGGAARRRGSGFRGGRIDRNSRRERIERMSSRGKRRGKGVGMRGGKKRAEDKEICIYHMQGKCHRGNDCPFSHDAMPPRKMELCKFYLMDCCAKKDKCLYMHSEFPCKYFHTGLKCFAGKNCKFSHAKLTDDLRAILNKTYNGLSGMNEFTSKHQEPTGKHRQHLETAPKEILGDFPRLREATRNLKKSKKIPSLFDLKISPPRDMQSDSDGNHTPMPSPTHQPNNKDFFRESMEREHTPPQIGERRRGEHHHHKSSEHHRSSKSGGSHASMQQQQQQRKESRRSDRGFEGEGSRSSRDRRDSKSAGGGSGRRSSREDSAAAGEHPHHHHHHHHNHHHHENSSRSSANNSGSGASSHAANNSRRQSYSPPNHRYEEDDEQEEPVNERLKAPEPDQSSNDLLSHLPKKQRELFLRIQQQQREAENSQESNPEDDDQDNDYNKQEENWYSSEDEESTPLTTILKSINIQKTSMTNSSHSPNQQRSHHHHHHNHHNHHNDQQSHTQVSDEHLLHESSSSSSSSALPVTIPDIDFGDVSALLSKVKQHIQTTADKLKVRDPRLRPDLEPSEKHHQHSTSISDSPHTHTDPPTHARTTHAHAPAQLSPSISAILNSAAAARGHHHPAPRSSPSHSHSPHHNSSSSSSFPPSHSSSYSSSSHHHSSSFPPPTPSMNDDDDGDDDDDDDNGISSPDDPFASEDQMSGLKGLPFKPAPVHTAATEIDASINSHPPIVYRLRPIQASKPDYSAIQNMPTGGALDPRWRKAVRFSEESGLGAASRRDPRHRLADDTPRAPAAAAAASSHPPAPAADPRQRLAAAMMNSTAHSMLAPPTPRYDDDPAPSSNMAGRGGAATPQMDAGMYCPPTPRLDDEPQPQPSPVMASSLRRTDPRQRQHLLNQPNQQQGMTSFYDQIRQQQQMQFMPNQQQMMFDPSRPMYGSDMPANINRQPQYNNYK